MRDITILISTSLEIVQYSHIGLKRESETA